MSKVQMQVQDAINKAIIYTGSQKNLAKACGVNPSSVSHWLAGNRKMNPIYAKRMEKATDGLVTRAELCPEIFRDDDD